MNVLRTSVVDLMESPVRTNLGALTVRSAAAQMVDHRIGSVVVTREGQIAGVFSEEDVCNVLLRGLDPDRQNLTSMMSWPVVSIPSTADLLDALKQMGFYNLRHLPVVDPLDGLMGIVSNRDVLHALVGLEDLVNHAAVIRRGSIGRAKLVLMDQPAEDPPTAIEISYPISFLDQGKTLVEAARQLRQSVSGLLVHSGKEGYRSFSVRDLTRAVAAGVNADDKVDSWLGEVSAICRPQTPLMELAREIRSHGVRHLIVAEGGVVAGVVSDIKLLKMFPQFVDWLDRHDIEPSKG